MTAGAGVRGRVWGRGRGRARVRARVRVTLGVGVRVGAIVGVGVRVSSQVAAASVVRVGEVEPHLVRVAVRVRVGVNGYVRVEGQV